MRIGLTLLVTLCAATAAAQLPAASPQRPARDTTVALDHIIAIVGDQPITQYDLQERLIAMQQQPGFKPPGSEAEFRKLALEVTNQLIDEEVLVQKAIYLKVEVLDNELTTAVDKQLRDIRGRFQSDGEYRSELAKAGLGSPEEYRRFLMDQMRRVEYQQRLIQKLRLEGKIPPVNVPQAEVERTYNESKASLPRRPATVTFRQIVVAPKPGATAKERARVKAESLLAEIKGGAEFDRVAKRESADSGSREQGGDLGWARRGVMVPEFEKWIFTLRPGDLSPVVETVHGFHVIRVDRVQIGEVRSRHVLVKPTVDSADVERARLEADSVMRRWVAGVAFDTLAKVHHDFANGEETMLLTPITRDSMPATYQTAFADKKAGETVVFMIPSRDWYPKFVVAQLVTVEEGGEYTLADIKERIRQQLVDEHSYRRFLDGLRKETFVRIRLDAPALGTAPVAKP